MTGLPGMTNPAAGAMGEFTDAVRERMVKLLGMLGSDALGERAVAAKKADDLRRELGVEWTDILVKVGGQQVMATPTPAAPDDYKQKALFLLLFFKAKLTQWELSFLQDIEKTSLPLTDKQRDKIDDVFRKATSGTPARRPFGAS